MISKNKYNDITKTKGANPILVALINTFKDIIVKYIQSNFMFVVIDKILINKNYHKNENK